MFKTDIDIIAKPALPLIVYGVIKGYIKNPFLFMLKIIISFKKYKNNINIDLPKEFIDSAAFMALLYKKLCEIMPNEKAFEITRASVLVSGLAVQQANFRNVEDIRSYDNLIKYQQRTNKEGSTKLNTMKIIEQSENKYEFKVTRCLFYELYVYLGVPELTSIMCSIDNAIFNSYLPEKLLFHRNGQNKTMPEGAKECNFVIENKTIETN